MSTVVQQLVEFEPHSSYSDLQQGENANASLARPAKVVSRTYPGVPQGPDSIELQRLPGHDMTGPTTPRTEADLEMSQPPTPTSPRAVVEVMPSAWNPYMNRFRLMAMCIASIGNGLTDSAAGALIPYMEK
jgi:hypothetical protein